MSSDTDHWSQKEEPEVRPQGDYTQPIARTGEQQFAAIVRNCSGFEAGEIDFGLRDVTHLPDAEQQRMVEISFALYEAACDQTGKRAPREVNKN